MQTCGESDKNASRELSNRGLKEWGYDGYSITMRGWIGMNGRLGRMEDA
jgi:hypothetical protein